MGAAAPARRSRERGRRAARGGRRGRADGGRAAARARRRGRRARGDAARARRPTSSARPTSPPSARSASCSPSAGRDDGFVGEEGGERAGQRAACAGSSTRSTGPSTSCSASRSGASASPSRDEQGTIAGAIYDPNRDELFTATRDGPRAADRPAGASRAAAARRDGPTGGEREAASGSQRRWSPPGSPTTPSVRAAQAQVLARLIPRGARHPPLRQRRARPRLDGRGALRRLLRAHGQAVGHRRRGADLRARRACACSSCPSTRTCRGGSSSRAPDLAEPLLELVGGPRRGCERGASAGWRSHAAGGIRTHTPFRTGPFEGPASTVPPPPQVRRSEDSRAAQAGSRRGRGVAAGAGSPRPGGARTPGRGARARRSSPG